jgi:signal transduction histidine kinase
LSGTDEIAELDRAVHFADQRLRAASEKRAELMRSLAEDMRSPLAQVTASQDKFAILAQDHLTEKSSKFLGLSNISVREVLGLLDDLLTVEETQAGKIELNRGVWSFSEPIEEAIGLVSGLASAKGCRIESQVEQGKVRADKKRLVQVLVNYLSNAIKFSPEESVIHVCAGNRDRHVIFQVIDQGPGMDAETCAHVFEKYFQGRCADKDSGYGLGLSICKMIAQAHGGNVGVQSEIGKGSKFWIELPQAE